MQLTTVSEGGLGWREVAKELIVASRHLSDQTSITGIKLCLLDTAFISQQGDLERLVFTSKSGAFFQNRNRDGFTKVFFLHRKVIGWLTTAVISSSHYNTTLIRILLPFS